MFYKHRWVLVIPILALFRSAYAQEEEVPTIVLEEIQKPLENLPKAAPLENRPLLTKGHFFIHGSFNITYKLTNFSYSQHALALDSKAGAGYFIKDLWAVGASIPASLTWVLPQARGGEVGLSLFSTYFFEIGKIFYPYLGADITPRFHLSERALLMSAGLHGGLLLGLSRHVALDFGLAPELYFRLNNQQKWQLKVPAGFIGIKAFF